MDYIWDMYDVCNRLKIRVILRLEGGGVEIIQGATKMYTLRAKTSGPGLNPLYAPGLIHLVLIVSVYALTKSISPYLIDFRFTAYNT